MSAELVAELEVELRTPALLDRHRERDAGLPGTACELGPVLLVDEEAGAVLRDTVRDCQLEALVHDRLDVGHACSLVGRRCAGDAEQVAAERAAMVEGEHVQRRHRGSSCSREGRT